MHQNWYTCPCDLSSLLYPPLNSYMETGCPCVAVCVCSSQPAFGPTPLLKRVHASVHLLISNWLPMSVHPLGIVTWNHGYPWVALYVSQSSYFYSNTLVKMCLCIVTCIYVHLTPYIRLTPPTSNWRSNLWMEVPPPMLIAASNGGPLPIGGSTSDGGSSLCMEVPPPIGGPTSEWRSHLKNADSSSEWKFHLNHPTSVPIPW